MRRVAALLALGTAAACASPDTRPERGGTIIPAQAVLAAAEAAPAGIRGVFLVRVQATGREGERVYLNSELDYRDQRNMTVNIEPIAARPLARLHGAPADIFFRGRVIEVDGVARRVRIDFVDKGGPTGKYYYQTHVFVSNPAQIRIVG
jgi:hypothetical protein